MPEKGLGKIDRKLSWLFSLYLVTLLDIFTKIITLYSPDAKTSY